MGELNKSKDNHVLAHFNEGVTEEMENYAIDVALKSSRYIFVSSGKWKKGYCTHCQSRFHIEEPVKQNASAICPKCNSKCVYKQEWRGRKYLKDSAVFLWFEKSLIESDVITAQWVYVTRDYSGSIENIKTKYTRTVLYTFKVGDSAMFEVAYWRNNALIKCNSVYNPNFSTPHYISAESLKDSVKGTQFEYCGWEKYPSGDLTKYLALFSKYPGVETLTKGGFETIVEKKLYGKPLYRTVNWNAFKLHDILKITKQDLNSIKNAPSFNHYGMNGRNFEVSLWLWQQARKEKSKLTCEQILSGCSAFNISTFLQEFKSIKKYATIHRIFNYAQKQYGKAEKHYGSPGQVLIMWRDYIKDCVELSLDLKNEQVLFPKNLKLAHDQTMKLVKIQADEIANRKVKKRYEQLEEMIFEADGFIIRPPESVQEIIDEGKKLDHCVGRYADKHYEGKCSLFFIRKVGRLAKRPFYTVEIIGNDVKQVRGLKNAPATKEIEAFMEKFKLSKMTKTKARKRA